MIMQSPMLLRFIPVRGTLRMLIPAIELVHSKLEPNSCCIIFLIFSGAVHFIASNNDSGVRDFDMENFQLSKHYHFPWPVNVSCIDHTCYFSDLYLKILCETNKACMHHGSFITKRSSCTPSMEAAYKRWT